MIDLTPLDVRKKRGDFGKGLRGYDPQEVDAFLELIAERMEVLVKENIAFREQIERLGEKVLAQEGRERAVQDALVTAQELRQDVKAQAVREAKVLEREARGRIQAMIAESEKRLTEHRDALQELERQRDRFLKAFRTFLERELDTVEVELGRAPLEDITLDLELGQGSWTIDEDDLDIDEDDDDDGGGDDAAAEFIETEGDESAAEFPEIADLESSAAESEAGGEETAVAKAVGAIGPDLEQVGPDAEQLGTGMEPLGSAEARLPVAEEGEDSLWLSSIMTDGEDEEAE